MFGAVQSLPFFVKEALVGMKRSGWMVVISIATITVSLIVFGFFLLVTLNMNHLAHFFSSKLELRVYLKPTVTKHEVKQLQNDIFKVEHVDRVDFIRREEAWKGFQKNFPTLQLVDLVNENPLPDSFRIFLVDSRFIPSLAEYIQTEYASLVDDVGYLGDLADRIEAFSFFMKMGGGVLVGLLTVATLLIIINTIRLTVMVRREEITIMHLVGATPLFIRLPFLLEGLIMGGIAGGISVVFLKFSYYFFGVKFQQSLPYFPLVFEGVQLTAIFGVVLGVGALLGMLGAYVSVSNTLKSSVKGISQRV